MKCGLLGKTLKHSYSPLIHSKLADYSYELYEINEEKLENFILSGDFDGINVTIPYKKSVIPFCDELSKTAQEIGSVNTIVKRNGKIYGDNTDYYGFLQTVISSGISVEGKKAIVLGSGGASLTVQTVLRNLGAGEIIVISRNGNDNYTNISNHFDAEVIVNTTPVGMYPDTLVSPIELDNFKECKAVFDLIYNPALTKLLLDAKRLNIPHFNGLYMLVSQAAKSSEIFTGRTISEEKIKSVTECLELSMKNIVLVGMPASGKTTIAKALAENFGREFIDIDEQIEEKFKMTIPQIFEKGGEKYFREIETKVLTEFLKESGKVISTGGGAVTIPKNYNIIRQNSVVIWIKRDLEKLSRNGRPLSKNADFNEMYAIRSPLYMKFSDFSVKNENITDTVNEIKEKLNENFGY